MVTKIEINLYEEYCLLVRIDKLTPNWETLLYISRGDSEFWLCKGDKGYCDPEVKWVTYQQVETVYSYDEKFMGD